jgi:hypothetical protein
MEGIDQACLLNPPHRSLALRLQIEARRPGRPKTSDQGYLRDVTLRGRAVGRKRADLSSEPLDLVGLFGFRLHDRSEHLAAFFDDAGVLFVDCDQLFEVLDPVIGERHHPVFTDANDP